MEWLNEVSNWLVAFFDKPVPIIGCTVGFLLVAILKIISSTSIGKKSLNTLKSSMASVLTKNEELVEQLTKERESVSNALNSKNEEVDALTEEYEAKLQLVANNYKLLEELVLGICKAISNKNVKELASKYSPMINDGINELVDQAKKEVEEEYSSEIEELKKEIEELKKLMEVDDGKDTDPVEE